MKELSHENDYREVLKAVLDSRVRGNPKYSLRAFARDLKVNPSRLSEVLNHKKGLSIDAAFTIGKRLEWCDDKIMSFCDLVQAKHGASAVQRQIAELRLQKHARSQSAEIDQATFEQIAEWYYLAILELTALKSCQNDPRWIAQQLGITVTEAQLATEKLLSLGILKAVGKRLVKEHKVLKTFTDIPSSSMRTIYQQLLKKAEQSLETQSLEEREFTSLTVAINTKNIKEAKRRIRAFRDEMEKLLESGEQTQVYNLGIQLFRLSKH